MTDDSLAATPSGRALLSSAQIHHVLRVEFGRARRHGYPLTCLVIAVDRLEILRDRLGYEAKELVVDAVVDLLRHATRSSDTLGRTPDDRLIAVVPHTEPVGAMVLARRIVERARALRLERLAEPFAVTLSIGSSTTSGGASMFQDALLAAAEGGLADAVAAGGDRVTERESVAPAP
jgi:diguanylate cyclase (GGDEF)-like protein